MEMHGPDETARSVQIAAGGIYTSGKFCSLMSALMSDLLTGKVTPQVANGVVNAGGKMLKAVELEQRYGTDRDGQTKSLRLVHEQDLLAIASPSTEPGKA
jgi:hypothetical protein